MEVAAVKPGLLATETKTFEARKPELLREGTGRFVLIKGEDVIGLYYAWEDALAEGARRFGNVPYLIAKVQAFEPAIDFTLNNNIE